MKEITFVIEWTIDAEDAIDGIDGVKESMTATGSCKVIDVRVNEKGKPKAEIASVKGQR